MFYKLLKKYICYVILYYRCNLVSSNELTAVFLESMCKKKEEKHGMCVNGDEEGKEGKVDQKRLQLCKLMPINILM